MSKDSKKSKFPSFDDVANIAGKLFNDLRKSLTEIVHDYKEKHGMEPEHEHKKPPKYEAKSTEETKKPPKYEPKLGEEGHKKPPSHDTKHKP